MPISLSSTKNLALLWIVLKRGHSAIARSAGLCWIFFELFFPFLWESAARYSQNMPIPGTWPTESLVTDQDDRVTSAGFCKGYQIFFWFWTDKITLWKDILLLLRYLKHSWNCLRGNLLQPGRMNCLIFDRRDILSGFHLWPEEPLTGNIHWQRPIPWVHPYICKLTQHCLGVTMPFMKDLYFVN